MLPDTVSRPAAARFPPHSGTDAATMGERRTMHEGIRIQADADGTFTLYSDTRIILRGLTRERAYRLAGRLGEFVRY
jgi:hypothetical protein